MVRGNFGSVPNCELFHLAVCAPIPLRLEGLAQPRQYKPGWLAIIVEDVVAVDKVSESLDPRMTDAGDKATIPNGSTIGCRHQETVGPVQ